MGILSSPTLQNLLTDVRIQINSPDPLNSFWGDSELTGYLNDAVRRYFTEAVQNNEGYFTVTTTLNITSGVETVALPTDCFEVKNLWKVITNGFVSLQYNNSLQTGYSTQGGNSGDNYFPYYYFQGNNLVLRPTPTGSQTGALQLEYTQFPTTMVYGGDTLTNQVSPIFKELIIMYAVYRAKLRESMVNGGSMHTIPASQVEALYNQFKASIVKRSKNPTFVSMFNPENEGF